MYCKSYDPLQNTVANILNNIQGKRIITVPSFGGVITPTRVISKVCAHKEIGKIIEELLY